MNTQTGDWLPLMEYAMRKGVSLSTLRRYIKAKKIEYRLEEGRYLLWDPESRPGDAHLAPGAPHAPNSAQRISIQTQAVAQSSSPAESQKLQQDLRQAQEEISELKTLIALYEEQMLGQEKDSH